MERRSFTREFKLEAVRLVKERGVSVAQAARDLEVYGNMLRKWIRDFEADPQHSFPGHGQMKPEQAEIARLKREVIKLKAERTARKTYRTRDHAKADVFDYIERFYNPKRRHSTLGYISPMEFEMKAGLA